ncbi:MAG: lyase family protein [Mycobacterium sp.]
MTNLLWPGDDRAGDVMTDAALLQAMLRIEHAWLQTLGASGLISADAANCDLTQLVTDSDRNALAGGADAGGNPIIELVALLRVRAPGPTRPWIHRGLTSQDVLDSALMLTLRDAVAQVRGELARQLTRLSDLTAEHRSTRMVARTLTQHAIPTMFGVKTAGWLHGLCDAAQHLSRLRTPVQIGGAAGTLAASTELAVLLDQPDNATEVAMRLGAITAEAVGLDCRTPWHTTRAPVTEIGDALVSCTDAWGHIAADVLTLNRPEIGEVTEAGGPGRGSSSTMPDKTNPVLSVLIRRTAMTNPPLAATLHTAAALANDERPDGAWHAEWDTIRTLARRTLVAASHATDLLTELVVHAEAMAANLAAAAVSGEQASIAAVAEKPHSPRYAGAANQLISAALDRAQSCLKELT